MRSHHHTRHLFSVHCLLALAIFAAFLGMPSVARADTVTTVGHSQGSRVFTTESYIVGPWAFGEFRAQDGVVSYCSNIKLGPPGGAEGASATYSSGFDAVTGGICYILRNGYPSKTTISGDSFGDLSQPSECARATTQVAIWMYTGDMTLEGDYYKDSVKKNAIEVCGGSERSRRCIAAAAALCQAARLHANDYCNMYVELWVSNSASTQSMYYGYPQTFTTSLTVQKASEQPAYTNGNSAYSLEGAAFNIYSDSALTQLRAQVSTNAAGTGSCSNLEPGTYYVQETTASKGFAKSTTIYSVAVPYNAAASVTVTEALQCARIDPVIYKRDAETGASSALGAATLAGGVYQITYYKTGSTTPFKTWTVTTNSEGNALMATLGGDSAFISHSGMAAFPLGTLVITEVTAPKGYTLSTAEKRLELVAQDVSAASAASGDVAGEFITKVSGVTMYDQVIRGDLTLLKVDQDTGEALAGIPFALTSATTGERHLVVTGSDGALSTVAAVQTGGSRTTSSLNANDAALDTNEKDVDPDALTVAAPAWFSGLASGANVVSASAASEVQTAAAMAKTSLGALPYDTYYLEELSVPTNWKYRLTGTTLTVSEDGSVISPGTVSNEPITVRTQASNTASDNQTLAPEIATVRDVVTYTGVRVGEPYTLVTSAMVINDDGTVLAVVDDNNTAVQATSTFTPAKADDTTEVTLTFDAYNYAGRTVVLYEVLLYRGTEVARHTDPLDTAQQLDVAFIPALRTTATFSDGTKSQVASGNLTVLDTITFDHFAAGTYRVVGTLMAKDTGAALTTATGQTITAQKDVTFIEGQLDCVTTMQFDFDATGMAAGDVVVFERAYAVSGSGDTQMQTLVAYHENLEDSYQTVELTAAPSTPLEELPQTGQSALLLAGVVGGAGVSGCGALYLLHNTRKQRLRRAVVGASTPAGVRSSKASWRHTNTPSNPRIY
jgi:TQXA domain-containing protein